MTTEKTLYKTTKKDIIFAILLIGFQFSGVFFLLHLRLQKNGFECGLLCLGDISSSMLYAAVDLGVVLFIIQCIVSMRKIPEQLLSYRSERLLLSQTSITYIPAETFFRKKKTAWTLQLSDITGCTVGRDWKSQLYVVLEAVGAEKSLRYSLWKDPTETARKRPFDFSFKKSPSDDHDFPIIRYLEQHFGEGFIKSDIDYEQADIFGQPFKKRYYSKGDKSFDLQSNPTTWAITIVFFLIILYAIFDLILNDYTYAGFAPATLFLSVGVAVSIVVLLIQLGKKIPAYVAVILAALVGVSSALAGYPALLRISSMSADKPVVSYTYQLQRLDNPSSSLYFTPVDTTLPEIKLRINYDDYWSQFETGSKHEFDLLQGLFWLWLLDTAPIRKKALDYRQRISN
jgi:hypothetical protein